MKTNFSPIRFHSGRAVLREDDAGDCRDGGPVADVRARHQRGHGLRHRARLRRQSLLASVAGHCSPNVRRDQAVLFRRVQPSDALSFTVTVPINRSGRKECKSNGVENSVALMGKLEEGKMG